MDIGLTARRTRATGGSAMLAAARWVGALCFLLGLLALLSAALQLVFIALGGHATVGNEAADTAVTAVKQLAIVWGGGFAVSRALHRLGVRMLPAERGDVVDERGHVLLSH